MKVSPLKHRGSACAQPARSHKGRSSNHAPNPQNHGRPEPHAHAGMRQPGQRTPGLTWAFPNAATDILAADTGGAWERQKPRGEEHQARQERGPGYEARLLDTCTSTNTSCRAQQVQAWLEHVGVPRPQPRAGGPSCPAPSVCPAAEGSRLTCTTPCGRRVSTQCS